MMRINILSELYVNRVSNLKSRYLNFNKSRVKIHSINHRFQIIQNNINNMKEQLRGKIN